MSIFNLKNNPKRAFFAIIFKSIANAALIIVMRKIPRITIKTTG